MIGAQPLYSEPKELLKPAQAAFLLDISTRTLNRLVATGRLPKPLKINRKLVRYRRTELLAFIHSTQPE